MKNNILKRVNHEVFMDGLLIAGVILFGFAIAAIGVALIF